MPEPNVLTYAPGPAGGVEDEEDGPPIDLRRYAMALLRFKFLIAGLAILGLGAGFVVSRLVERVYEAQATIQIDAATRNSVRTSPIQDLQLLESRAWIDLLRSFRVLDEVVRRRRLYVEPATREGAAALADFAVGETFTPGSYSVVADAAGSRVALLDQTGQVVDDVAAGDSIGRSLGFHWAPRLAAGQTAAFVLRTPRDAAVRLNEAIQFPQLSPDGSFLRISMRGTDPVAITATINAVAERFVEVAAYLKRDKLSQVTEVLRAQLERSSIDLRNAENALETFKVSTITLPSERGTPMASGLAETRDPVRMAFFRLRLDRDSLAQEREAIERALRVAPDSNVSLVVVLGTIPSVRNSGEIMTALSLLGSKRTELRQMRLTFGPSHPPLVALEREVAELESVTVPGLARALAANHAERIADFDARIASSSREMQAIPARASEEARRQRNVVIQDNLFTGLQAAYEQARLAELSSTPDVRVLDVAEVPTQPVTDQVLLIIAVGMVVGLGLGVLLALVLDHFDKRFRYPDQVTRGLGLSILGAIPLMETGKDGRAKPDAGAQLVEALRSIRMNLIYAHGMAGPFITTVTSPGPGDGKSFLAANLARAFASSGRRTILIDGDTRRGVLHRMFECDRRPGLLDFLSGTATVESVIRRDPAWEIDFVPCGTRRSGGPELLASPQFSAFVGSLRVDYDAIIIDSPPLGAGVDALILGSLTGSLVMVLRTGVTDRDLAESRLSDLNRLPIRVLGAVLNDVRTEGVYKYYSYLPGYRAEDETEAAQDAPVAKSKRIMGTR